jgi:phage terminase small subunit
MPYNHLTEKQEIFCIKYYVLGNASEAARLAGYSPKYASVNTHQLLKSPLVKARLQELRQAEEEMRQNLETELIMDVTERKQRLTEIARARLTDFMELGQDGSWVNIGEETPKGGAIQEIHSRTEYDDDGSKPTVYTSVKLHDPMKAIDLLNKMDKIYSEGAQINIDNRKIEITVVSEKAKELTEAIIQGVRTEG